MNATAEGRWESRVSAPIGDAVISVDPVAGGWCVSGPIEEDLIFRTGGRAEYQARTLGQRLAALGQTAIVEIHDLEGAIAGSVLYLAEEQAGLS
jgi:hypothetical protein